MTTDFEKIPEVVFELFREIYWDPEEHGPAVLRPGERSKAMMVAYGWNPPLIDDMRVRDGRCAAHFTEHGLAAYAWREMQSPATPPATSERKLVSNEDFIEIGTLWPDRFKNYPDAKRYLDTLPNEPHPAGIRNRQKGQRRLVHELDWIRHFREKDRKASELLDDEALQEQLADIEGRKAEERERKKRGK